MSNNEFKTPVLCGLFTVLNEGVVVFTFLLFFYEQLMRRQ